MADQETNLVIRATDKTKAAIASASAGLENLNPVILID